MDKKPVILIIENSTHVTGALKSITRTAYDLQSFFSFVFIVPKNSAGRFWIEDKGFTDIVELEMKEISRRLLSAVSYLPYLILNGFKLRQIIKDKEVALVHVNDLYNLLPVVAWFMGSRVPYVCHVRFLPNRFPRVLFNFWLKLHLRFARQIISVSDFLKKSLPEDDLIICISNHLPIQEKYAAPKEIVEEKDVYTFLYLGNVIGGKGQDHALEAFIMAHHKLPDWRIRFVGGDMGLEKNRAFQQKLNSRAKQAGIAEKIEWEGFTEGVEKEYKAADIVLNFSESESFSLTCLEALYFGRPLIATDCGGPADIIDQNKTGLLVPNRDVKAMADAMVKLACDPEWRSKMAEEGSISVRNKFSVENTSYVLKDVYHSALNKSR